MPPSNGTNAQAALSSLRAAIENKEVELVIEPRLRGNPHERLHWFQGLSEEAIAGLGSQDVEYYFKSSHPLNEYNGSDVLARGTYSALNAAGQPIYYYRLNGKYMPAPAADKGKAKNTYFDISNLDYRKFTPGDDPFFLIHNGEKTKFGIGIARTPEEDYALVIRSADEPSRVLDGAGLEPSEIIHRPRDKLHTAIVPQLPHELAESIRLAHNLPEPLQFDVMDNLLAKCRSNVELFAPVLPESAPKPLPPSPQTTTEPVSATAPEALLPDALKAYGATIEGRRKGDGTVQYTLVMNGNADNSGDAEWKTRFRKPQDVAAYLARTVGFSPPSPQSGEVQRFGIEPDRKKHDTAQACIAALAEVMKTDFDPATIQPFALPRGRSRDEQFPNHFRFQNAGKVRLYLLEEDGKPFVVGVKKIKQYHTEIRPKAQTDIPTELPRLIGRLGIKFEKKDIETGKLLTIQEHEQGLSSDAYYTKIPIERAVYEDLKADNIPVLPTTENLIKSIRTASAVALVPKPLTLVVPSTTAPPPNASALPPQNAGQSSAVCDAKLVDLLGGIRNEMSEFYIASVKEGENPRHYAYLILTPKRLKSFRNNIGAINEEYKTSGMGIAVKELYRAGEVRSNKQMRILVAVPLPENCFTALAQTDSTRRAANHGYEIHIASPLDAKY